jgi:hypothetical protein
VVNGKTSVTWKDVGSGSILRGDFPSVEGPPGTEGACKRQVPVLRDPNVFTDEPGDLLKVWLHLQPLPMAQFLPLVNAQLQVDYPGQWPVTEHES